MTHEVIAEVVFAGFMAVVVGTLVVYLLVALYRERRARKAPREEPAARSTAE